MRISDELALGRQVAVVAHVENTIGLSFQLHFTKMKSFGAKFNVVALSLTTAREVKLVTSFCIYTVVPT